MDPLTSFITGLAMLALSYTVQAIGSPKANKPKPAMIQEFDFPQVEESTPQSVVFGDVWIEDWTVLWYGNYRNRPIKSDGSKK